MSKLDLARTPLLNPDGKTINPQWLLYLLGQNTDTNTNTTSIATLSTELTALTDEVESAPLNPAIPIITALATRVAALECAPLPTKQDSGMKIKDIQRGTIQIGNTTTSQTATITSVDTTKTELRFLGSNNSTASAEPKSDSCILVLTDAVTITASRQGNGGNLNVSWELTEWQ